MCGRYVRRSDKQKIAEVFHAATGDLSDLNFAPDGDIRPTTNQPIIRANRDTGDRELVTARWGFIPSWQKPNEKFPPTTFNARSEGIEKASMWRNAFTRHRCLVPADSFFEWKKIRPKNNPKYEIGMSDGEPFAFAGLWGAWLRPGTTEWIQSFTIITTDPNELMQRIHTRMPVILYPRDYDRWLSREATDSPPLDLLRPFEAEAMSAHLTARFIKPMQRPVSDDMTFSSVMAKAIHKTLSLPLTSSLVGGHRGAGKLTCEKPFASVNPTLFGRVTLRESIMPLW